MSPSYLKRFSPIPKRASAPVEVASRRRADAHAVLSFLLPIDRRARKRLATALEHSAWHASAMAVRNSPKRILCCPLCLRRLAARSLYGTSLGEHGVGYVASTGASQASGSAHWRSEMESGWRIFLIAVRPNESAVSADAIRCGGSDPSPFSCREAEHRLTLKSRLHFSSLHPCITHSSALNALNTHTQPAEGREQVLAHFTYLIHSRAPPSFASLHFSLVHAA